MRSLLLSFKPAATVAILVVIGGLCRLTAQSDAALEKLVHRMTGDFSSQMQSMRDSDYYDIRLHVRPIWTNDGSAHWLYVEQASAADENKPYRQRIYKVENAGELSLRSSVYTLPSPEKWIGAYNNTDLFETLTPADITLLEGCTVYMEQQNGVFTGSTRGKDCQSKLKGAQYATSTVLITDEMLISWDQGFDADGKQVWGATRGGYEFIRQ